MDGKNIHMSKVLILKEDKALIGKIISIYLLSSPILLCRFLFII